MRNFSYLCEGNIYFVLVAELNIVNQIDINEGNVGFIETDLFYPFKS